MFVQNFISEITIQAKPLVYRAYFKKLSYDVFNTAQGTEFPKTSFVTAQTYLALKKKNNQYLMLKIGNH